MPQTAATTWGFWYQGWDYRLHTHAHTCLHWLMRMYTHAHTPYLSSLKSLRKISSAFCRNCCIVLPFFIYMSRPQSQHPGRQRVGRER